MFGIAFAGIMLQDRLAYHDLFSVMALIMLLTAAPVLWLRQRRAAT